MNWNKLLSKKRIRRSNPSKDIRNEFESDFGRIMYSPALRRMHDKTQVFPLTTDDNIHSRLTHSNEVMSIGYTLGLKLVNNKGFLEKFEEERRKDLMREIPILMQNICLVHDIGNAPFGHFGETMISDYFKNLKKDKKSNFSSLCKCEEDEVCTCKSKDFTNYDGNAQGLRVLTKLQYLDNPFGLNLTYGVLGAFIKYPNYHKTNKEYTKELEDKKGEKFKDEKIENSKHGIFFSERDYFEKIVEECGLKVNNRIIRHPLCYLMEAADSIAYLCMDMEDGFNKGLYDIDFIIDKFEENFSSVAIEIKDLKHNKKMFPNSKMVQIRISLIQYFVNLAFENFIKNLKKIEKGEYSSELIEDDENKVYNVLKGISREIFKCREISYLETTGHSVFQGLLNYYEKFAFSNNHKYVAKVESLISNSIIDCAIDENLSSLSENKLKVLIENKKNEIKKFKNDENYLLKLEEKKTELENKLNEFNELNCEYKILFKKQFNSILEKEEKYKLSEIKSQIYKIVEPSFKDLDTYFKYRVILDFISGMTDQFALNHYQRISGQKIR